MILAYCIGIVSNGRRCIAFSCIKKISILHVLYQSCLGLSIKHCNKETSSLSYYADSTIHNESKQSTAVGEKSQQQLELEAHNFYIQISAVNHYYFSMRVCSRNISISKIKEYRPQQESISNMQFIQYFIQNYK